MSEPEGVRQRRLLAASPRSETVVLTEQQLVRANDPTLRDVRER